MSTDDENKAGLVPSQSSALSRSGATSLIRRGTQDLRAREEAEQWCKRGSALWHQQRYEEAVECFRRGLQLDPNHAFLQFSLGAAYYQGNGVPERDYTQAEFWLRKAAEQGHATSQAVLGIMCEWSFGVPQDYAQALAWYRKAAEQGNAGAGYALGCYYWEGRGVLQDYEQARAWFRKAAELGDASAQFNLGVICGFGQGLPQDDAEAVFWYRKAAEQGDALAQFNLGVMYHFGRGVPQDDAEAVSWFRKAAEQRHGGAANNLAVSYARGRGVPQDYEQAVRWYRVAAEQGDESARTVLATLRTVKMPEPSNPQPSSESEPRYPKLSPEQLDRVLDDLKEHLSLSDQQRQEPVSPSQYARIYASGLGDRAEFLASSLVAFSGKQPASETAADSEIVFENHFEMEVAGFEPVTEDICSLVAPSVSEMENESLFNSAYQVAVAFLCLYSADVAHKSMQPENAEEFSYALDFSIAAMSAGRFGFHPEPRNVFEAIQELRPNFVRHKMLDMESFGRGDVLGTILNQLSMSPDRQTRYAFVVGSRKQSLSCATHFVKVIDEISDYIKRCAQEVGWQGIP